MLHLKQVFTLLIYACIFFLSKYEAGDFQVSEKILMNSPSKLYQITSIVCSSVKVAVIISPSVDVQNVTEFSTRFCSSCKLYCDRFPKSAKIL